MKTVNSKKSKKRIRLVSPPAGVIKQLEKAALENLAVARGIMGLFDSIAGHSTGTLFPKYRWRPSELSEWPRRVARAGRSLLNWGLKPGAILNEIFVSRIAVAKHVTELRRNSPLGRRCLKEVRIIRKKYPVTSATEPFCSAASEESHDLNVLEDLVGQPLNARAVRFVVALSPKRIQVLGAKDPCAWRLPLGTATVRLAADGYTIESIKLTLAVQKAHRVDGKIHGELIDFFETGTEGLIWAVTDDVGTGYDALHMIDEGDHLSITDTLGTELWSGRIRCDRKAGWRRYPRNPKYGQPSALGYWVHWTQSGFTPDDWASFFVRPSYDRCRCILTRKATRASKGQSDRAAVSTA